MNKPRTAIPKSTRQKVLEEFNHRCAIGGEIRPQLHHIDGDHLNHDPENLIPLCPNCHLTDSHNPTQPINPKILRLFRIYKDPTILSSEFVPLYKRMEFLYSIGDDQTLESLDPPTHDLINFIHPLKMGEYYYARIWQLIRPPSQHPPAQNNSDPMAKTRYELYIHGFEIEYRHQIRTNYKHVEELVIELLRYQDWAIKKPINEGKQ